MNLEQVDIDLTNLYSVCCSLTKLAITQSQLLNKYSNFAITKESKEMEEVLNEVIEILHYAQKGERYVANAADKRNDKL